MDNSRYRTSLLSWNVRGLNCGAKCEDVKQVVNTCRPELICIQETKLAVVTDSVINDALGHDYTSNYLFLPAVGTRGGIIVASRSPRLKLLSPYITTNTITVTVEDEYRHSQWNFTGVYGPQEDLEKRLFLRELRQLRHRMLSKWVILGDFNLIYQDEDKNNGRLDRRMMSRFCRTLNKLEVKEVPLNGKKYTWSNHQDNPTLTRIDRVFHTPD